MDFGSPSSLVLEQSMTADQDQIHLTYQTDALGLSAENPGITGFRPSASSYQCLGFGANLGELPVTFMLHPINLFVTKDAQVKIAYRGVPGMMVPRKWIGLNLRQAKCYAVTLLGLGLMGSIKAHKIRKICLISW